MSGLIILLVVLALCLWAASLGDHGDDSAQLAGRCQWIDKEGQ